MDDATTQLPTTAGIDPLVGTIVDGRYRVDEFLAAGGMASVYRAHDTRLGRDIALKVIHPHLALNPDLARRFTQEAAQAASLAHPGIVAIHDQGEIAGRGYFVMELVDGRNLRAELNRLGALTLGTTLDIIEAILAALAAAHRRGVVHRDVKPENVLLSPDGDIKVADFGLAHAVSTATGTATETVMGTVAYIAPELVTRGAADAASDIYSVGIMLYELLTGATPYDDEPPIRVAWHHVNDTLPLPSDTQRWVPAEVDELFRHLTATDPAERLATGTDALRELRRVRQAIPAELLGSRADIDGTETYQSTAPLTTSRPTSALGALPAARTPGKAQRQGKPRKVVLALLPLLLVLLAAAVATWWFVWGPGARIAVPNVANMTIEQAEKTLTDAGLTPKRDVEFSDDIPAGKVSRTDPPAGTSLKLQAHVTVFVSQGVHMVHVPEGLEGQNREAVEAALAEQTLKVGEVGEEYSNDIAEGLLIRLSPEPGAVVVHDSAVDLVFSKGREPVTVPALAGIGLADAKAQLEAAGLGVNVTEDFSDSVATGTVISQDPANGTQAFKGDTVTLVVSKGPQMVTVPNVRGQKMADAEATLKALGLNVTKRKRLLGVNPNNVYDQSPAGGTSVKVGSTVTLDYV